MALLEIENLEVNYGMIKALKGVSFEVNKGEIIALIGANGSGKTKTLHAISGILPSTSGKLIYNGQNITKTPAHKIVKLGISQVPEGRRVFTISAALAGVAGVLYSHNLGMLQPSQVFSVYRMGGWQILYLPLRQVQIPSIIPLHVHS
mgnify:CR=1 FL=1